MDKSEHFLIQLMQNFKYALTYLYVTQTKKQNFTNIFVNLQYDMSVFRDIVYLCVFSLYDEL